MSTPSLHGSLTPLPRDRDIRAATVSIATAGAILLAVIAAALVPGSPIYALLTAAGVVLGAASVIFQLRHRNTPRLYQWLSALGGLVILTIGLLVAVARFGSSPMLTTAGMVASFYLMPIAALACYLGGLGQLPMRWVGPVLMSTGGAAGAMWLSLGSGSGSTRLLIALAAAISVIGCAFPLVRTWKTPPTTPPGRIILLPAVLMVILMIYMTSRAILPELVFWVSPVAVAWGYMVSGALATIAGLLMPPEH